MSDSDVFLLGGVKSKGGNEGGGEEGSETCGNGGKLWGWQKVMGMGVPWK